MEGEGHLDDDQHAGAVPYGRREGDDEQGDEVPAPAGSARAVIGVGVGGQSQGSESGVRVLTLTPDSDPKVLFSGRADTHMLVPTTNTPGIQLCCPHPKAAFGCFALAPTP